MHILPFGRRMRNVATHGLNADRTPAQQRQTQLLSITMLILLVVGACMSAIGPLLAFPGQPLWADPLFTLSVGAVLAVAANYLILRRGYYVTSAMILVLITAVGSIAISLRAEPARTNVDLYLLIPVIIASLFLHAQLMWRVILGYGVCLLALDAYVVALAIRAPIRIDALLVIGALIALSRVHHERIERDRTLALAVSESRLRSITNTISDIIIHADHDLTIRFMSPSFTRLIGLPSEAFLGRSIRSFGEMLHPDDNAAEIARFLSAIDRREPASLTHRLRRADGSYLWLETVCSPSYEAGGQSLQVTLSSRDLSDRIEAEEMRALDRMKDAFLSTVAHELRTPMTTIHGYAELLTLTQPDEDRHYFLEQIQQRTLQASRIIDDLLDVARIKAQGEPALQRGTVAIPTLVDDEVRVFREIYPDNVFQIIHAENLPLVDADGMRITQVLRNLLSNAVKDAPANSPILLQTSARGGGVEVRVCDRGAGLSATQQALIFEPFYRADGHRHIQGTGLGLTISRAIIELHGGEIRVESAPNQGRCFMIWLPGLQ